jgi:glycosyltransferase involved in cell wall biosynthesis
MIRIGIYGNNLNQGYFLAGLFRRQGVQAKVLLPAYAHAQDTHEWWSGEALDESLIVRLSAMPVPGAPGPLLSQPVIREMYAAASDFDVLILREEGPALFSEFAQPAKVFASQGADLQLWPWWLKTHFSPTALFWEAASNWRFPYESTFFHKVGSIALSGMRRARSMPDLARRQQRQRAGIAQCGRAIIFPYQRYLLDALSYPAERVRCIPLPNTPPQDLDDHVAGLPDRLPVACREAEILFVHPARMFFLPRDGNCFLKDNDKLIRGFADFLRGYAGNVQLVLFEKGLAEDLHVARRLVRELGIADRVVWLPELSNRELRSVLSHPRTVVCDQYSPFVNTLGNLGRESVYFGRPLITSYDGEDDPMYSCHPPNIFFANSVATVADAMRQVAALSEGDLQALVQTCATWYRLNLDPLENARRYLDVCIEAMVSNEENQKS